MPTWPTQRLHRARVGAALVGSLRGTGGSDSQEQLQEGVGENRPSLGVWKAADHRRGHRPTQGPLRLGAPQAKMAAYIPAGSGSTTSLGDRCATWPTFGLSGYASLVLG